ncbi:MAG TPA: hypothetical protein DCW86_01210 [Actinobacteria bacterium]|nr:hypothetical protein [Actinomycetota bacterium]
MRKTKALWTSLITVIVAALGLSFLVFPCFPARAEGRRKVILIVIDRLSLGDLTENGAPNLHRLSRRGAVGLMNARSAGAISSPNCYLSVGAGARADGESSGGLAFNTQEIYEDELAGEVFLRQTGITAPPQGVVNLAIANISRRCIRCMHDVYPGALGGALRKSGLKAGVVGNADLKDVFRREVSLIAMDSWGRVPYGDVSHFFLKASPTSPSGWRTDYQALLPASLALLEKVDFLVIETGDTARVNATRPFFADRRVAQERAAAVRRADDFIEKLVSRLNLGKTLVIIAVPTPSTEMIKEKSNLTPLFLLGGNVRSGVLTSQTTRHHGIVTNLDIAPTALTYLGAEIPHTMLGRPLGSEPQDDPLCYLASLNERAINKAQIRVPVLTTYVTLIAITLLVSTLILLARARRKYLRIFQYLLLWLLCVPVTLLMLSFFSYSSFVFPVLFTALVSALIAGIAWNLRKTNITPIAFACLLTMLVLVGDILGGSPLMQRSILGYCFMIGARYYGIGNEYMGILIGSSIAGLTALLDIYELKRWPIGLAFLVLVFVIGHPALGANVGGTIAAVVGYSVAYLLLSKGRFSAKQALATVLSVFLALVALIFFDLLMASGGSHLAGAIALIQKGGYREALQIIQRKFAMNVEGTLYTVWTRVLLSIMVIFPILLLRPMGALKRVSLNYPHLTMGFMGVAAAAIAAFVFNDTGAAAASTTIIFVIASLLYIIMEEQVIA